MANYVTACVFIPDSTNERVASEAVLFLMAWKQGKKNRGQNILTRDSVAIGYRCVETLTHGTGICDQSGVMKNHPCAENTDVLFGCLCL